jgi:predicted amidophosphoribosyltransferase
MVETHPRVIRGNWSYGVALDVHTTGSTYTGDNQFGHPTFSNTYSDMGELLNRLKYHRDQAAAPKIIAAATKCIRASYPKFDVIVPVRPSTPRTVQPVLVMANGIGEKLGIPVIDCISKTRDVGQVKNITDPDERAKALKGLYNVNSRKLAGKRVLLFDDLFRSGATMNEIAHVLLTEGEAADVYALTVTWTRKRR